MWLYICGIVSGVMLTLAFLVAWAIWTGLRDRKAVIEHEYDRTICPVDERTAQIT
jgi:TRAP-type C4-dicarboxylate transport system permease large subunit